jgi:branched-chain amino acid aminotransferase
VGQVFCFQLTNSGPARIPTNAETLNDLSLSLPQGVYTTFRTYPGNLVLRLGAHLDRLVESALLEGVSLSLDQPQVRSTIAAAIQEAGWQVARVRVTVGFAPTTTAIFISLVELDELPEAVYRTGVRCTIADRSLQRELPRSKSTHFIGPGTEARASAADASEVLLVNDMGQVLEGSSSNFFAVLNGVLRTAGDGVLAGVTRGIVLEAANGLLPIVTEPISLDDIPNLREAFITSISRAVLPVVAIDAEVVGSGVPGPYTREIIQRFNARLERELEPIS